MTAERPPAVVYTDLDGTLLDHDSYRWDAAAPALQALAARGIPWVPVTSKTVPEVLALRETLSHRHPFAVENGGAVCVPRGYFDRDRGEAFGPDLFVERLAPAYADILAVLADLRRDGYRFAGFADMDDAAVAMHTGLSVAAAAAARDRLCSEPLVWEDGDDALERFARAIAAAGLTLRRGGRFLHVLGAHKGDAVRRLHARFAAGGPVLAWALGDSENDLDMLAAADCGALVARPDGSYVAPADPPRLVHAGGVGPAGWRRAVEGWLDELEHDKGSG